MQTYKSFVVLLLFHSIFSTYIYGQDLNLIIKGESQKETSLIDSLGYKQIFDNYLALEQEVYQLHNVLQKDGYIESKLLGLTKKNDTLFEAQFSLRKKYDTIYIYYNNELVKKSQLKNLSTSITDTYFTIPISNTETVLNQINQNISKQGLPFTTLTLSKIKKKDDHNLEAHLIIDPNQKRSIDTIVIKGYDKFPESFLKHFLKLKKNEHLNITDITKKTELINSIPFANQNRSPEILFTKDSSTVYLYLKKNQTNSFDGFLGFGTNETTNKLEFDGYLNLNLINNLNYGESINLKYKSDENDQKTFNIETRLPYIFKSPIGLDLSLNIFKKDSSFTTTDQSAKLFYQINNKHIINAGVLSIKSNNLLTNESQQPLVKDFATTYYNIGYEYLDRQTDDQLFPINFLFNSSLGFGFRKKDNQKQNQTTFNIGASKIFNLNTNNSIFINTQSQGTFSDTFLNNELHRFGGITNIRGFEENSIFASLYGILSTEYRYRISPSLYIHSITDVAYFENDINDIKEKLFGFGFGFGILTKAGLLKFNYANGKSEDQKLKLSNSKIHLSLNAKF